jgi:hypothetical protein
MRIGGLHASLLIGNFAVLAASTASFWKGTSADERVAREKEEYLVK